jgi:hypothetical protein
MIAPLILAALMNLFQLAPTPSVVTSSFPITGVAVDAAGVKTRTTTGPVLRNTADGNVVDLSFISPVTGLCIVGEVVTFDGTLHPVGIDEMEVRKGNTVIESTNLPTLEQLTSLGGDAEYLIYVGCKGDAKPGADAPIVYSQFYKFIPLASTPA